MRAAIRALGLLMSVVLVAAIAEPHLGPTTRSAAQGAAVDLPLPEATPLAQAAPPLPPSEYPGFVGPPPVSRTLEPRERCPDPEEPASPLRVVPTPTVVPLYQPVPYSTGEFVTVSDSNGHGANMRAAPRALARILRVVPEGEILEVVGADLKVDRVYWGYVRDEYGLVGWIVSHMLTGVTRVPGRGPLGFQTPAPAACATFTPTPTPVPVQINVTPATGTGAPGGGDGGAREGLIGAREPVDELPGEALARAG
jgi:hypothetical protein